MIKNTVVWLITLYQRTISPDHGYFKSLHPNGFCRFYPSCSEYTRKSIQKHGIIKGFFLGINRILKCVPWSQPRVDLIKD